jgi:1-phosphatidylinositol-3-phosphate 5-kinase
MTAPKLFICNAMNYLQALQEDLTNRISSTQTSSPTSESGPSRPMIHRKVSVGYQEERLVTNPNAGLSNNDRRSILQQSNSLKQLYEDMSRELLNQNRGEDLVVFLISNNKSSNKTHCAD